MNDRNKKRHFIGKTGLWFQWIGLQAGESQLEARTLWLLFARPLRKLLARDDGHVPGRHPGRRSDEQGGIERDQFPARGWSHVVLL